MPIDRVGKGGMAPPAAPTGGAEKAQGTQAPKPFDLHPAGVASPVAATGAPSSGALERFRAGELDLDGYLDAKVSEATAHLGALRPAELVRVREALRDHLESDPAMVELVRRATGEAPVPKE
jgi:hypothetical protein